MLVGLSKMTATVGILTLFLSLKSDYLIPEAPMENPISSV